MEQSLYYAKMAERYIKGIHLSGSVKLLDYGLDYIDLNDIDLFAKETDKDAIERVQRYLTDNGFVGECIDKYGNVKTTQFKGKDKTIDLNIIKKDDIIIFTIPEIVAFKFKRNTTQDLEQIKKICEFGLKNRVKKTKNK